MPIPTIKVLFTGLMDFYWNGASFEIGVFKEEDHCLYIGVQKWVSGEETEFKVFTFKTPYFGGCDIQQVTGEEVRLDVTKLMGRMATPRPSEHISSPPSAYDDMRHCIIMDGPGFHNSPSRPLPHDEECFSPSIHINHGIFYTELSTRVEQQNSQGNTVGTPDIAWYIGADVDLVRGEYAVLTCGDGPPYRMDHDPNTNYVIFIENACYEADEPDTDYTDFELFYECFDIPEHQRFRLKIIEHKKDAYLRRQYPVIDRTRNCVWGEDFNKEHIISRNNPCDPMYTRFNYSEK